MRIVHDYRRADGTVDDDAIARLVAMAPVPGLTVDGSMGGVAAWVRARDEGSWGNGIRATLRFRVRPFAPPGIELAGLILPRRHELDVGALIRVLGPAGIRLLVRVTDLREEWGPGGRVERRVRAVLDQPVPPALVRSLELVEGELTIEDGAGLVERLVGLGLSPGHPRWIARVLREESEILLPAVNPDLPAGHPFADWEAGRHLAVDPELLPCVTEGFRTASGNPVVDGYRDIVHDDFLDRELGAGRRRIGTRYPLTHRARRTCRFWPCPTSTRPLRRCRSRRRIPTRARDRGSASVSIQWRPRRPRRSSSSTACSSIRCSTSRPSPRGSSTWWSLRTSSRG